MARAKIKLTFLSPTDRETVAQWLESKVRGYPDAIAKAQDAIARGINPPGLPRQILYWEDCIAFCKKLAWDVRTERGAKYPTPKPER